MRKDHYSPPVKWTREYRQTLKLGDAHFKVYCYLEGGPESHATGLYFITPATIAEMTREDREAVVSVMEDLEQVGLILWDQDADVVLVPAVCAEQYRWNRGVKHNDLRLIEARRHLNALPTTYLRDVFLGRWPVFRGDAEGATVGATQGATQAPTHGASVGACIGATSTTRSISPSDPLNSAKSRPKSSGWLTETGSRSGGVIR